MRRGIRSLILGAAAVILAVGLVGCAPEPDPVVVELDELQGTTVEVPLNSELIILTDWSDVESYGARIADSDIAEFIEGANTGDAAYTPRVKPLQVGETQVTVTNEETDERDVVFTLEVTEAP